jgi:hypothetical protein
MSGRVLLLTASAIAAATAALVGLVPALASGAAAPAAAPQGRVIARVAVPASPVPASGLIAPIKIKKPLPTHSAPPPALTVAPAQSPAPAPALPRNRLESDDGSLSASVGIYSDCFGTTPLRHAIAAVDTCVPGRTYFIGHNPGVFTPLLQLIMGPEIHAEWFGLWEITCSRLHCSNLMAPRTLHGQ